MQAVYFVKQPVGCGESNHTTFITVFSYSASLPVKEKTQSHSFLVFPTVYFGAKSPGLPTASISSETGIDIKLVQTALTMTLDLAPTYGRDYTLHITTR